MATGNRSPTAAATAGAAGAILGVALSLAGRGFPVFRCATNAKVPIAGSRGCRDATTCPTTITKWWSEAANCNLAAATGHLHWVLDVDPRHDGEASLARLEARCGTLPATVEIVTPSGGRHLWFKWIPARPISNSAGKLGSGLDVRGAGGYGLVPPSVVDGRPYCWSVDSASIIADAPDWLLALAAAPRAPAVGVLDSARDWTGLAGHPIGEGRRNDTLARVAGLLLRKRVDPRLALDLVQGLNFIRCDPPLPAAEVQAVVESIAKKELARLQRGSARGT